MTEVEFHTGVADPLAFACRLLRKATRAGARLQVAAPPALLEALDRSLWQFDEREFIAHARAPEAAPAVLGRSPVWLVRALQTGEGAPSVVVNLGLDALLNQPGITRLIEVLSLDVDEVAAGRARWRAYKQAGLAVVHHSASGTAAG